VRRRTPAAERCRWAKERELMRVLIAGATGALGVPVVRTLAAAGHEVIGLARTRARAQAVERLGARVFAVDALDGAALRTVMMSTRPEIVVHALTAIPLRGPLRTADLQATNRLRTAGTRNLLAAAIATGVKRIVVESMVFIYGFQDLGDVPLTEDALPARHVPKPWLQPAIDALVSEESQVLEATRSGRIEGIVLRFGGFYGLGAGSETMIHLLRRRALPVVNHSASRAVPWIEISDAASAVVTALSHGQSGAVYNIADDEGVPAWELIRHLAQSVGAPRPWAIPAWVMRLTAPFAAAAWLDTTLSVSNAKARRDLAWSPRFPSYREGIAHLATQLHKTRCRE
jgi:nucleoside-diphosphate-sugar epimerase